MCDICVECSLANLFSSDKCVLVGALHCRTPLNSRHVQESVCIFKGFAKLLERVCRHNNHRVRRGSLTFRVIE